MERDCGRVNYTRYTLSITLASFYYAPYRAHTRASADCISGRRRGRASTNTHAQTQRETSRKFTLIYITRQKRVAGQRQKLATIAVEDRRLVQQGVVVHGQ